MPRFYLPRGRSLCLRCAIGERMVVGRTLWDFIIEMSMTPGAGAMILVLFVLLELIIIVILLVHSGIFSVKLNYGGLELGFNHLIMIIRSEV